MSDEPINSAPEGERAGELSIAPDVLRDHTTAPLPADSAYTDES